MSILFGSTMALLERGMDVSLARQSLTAANVANLDTPGYTPRDVDFARSLEIARADGVGTPRRTHARHLTPGASGGDDVVVADSPDIPEGLDGNAVDLDTQMARMAETAVMYQANSRAISKKFALMRYVASEGMA